jgi:hypothetical protein
LHDVTWDFECGRTRLITKALPAGGEPFSYFRTSALCVSYNYVLHTPEYCTSSTGTLAPISNMESLDFCAISESESNVVPFKFVCKHIICFESHLFFLSFIVVNALKKGIFQ